MGANLRAGGPKDNSPDKTELAVIMRYLYHGNLEACCSDNLSSKSRDLITLSNHVTAYIAFLK